MNAMWSSRFYNSAGVTVIAGLSQSSGFPGHRGKRVNIIYYCWFWRKMPWFLTLQNWPTVCMILFLLSKFWGKNVSIFFTGGGKGWQEMGEMGGKGTFPFMVDTLTSKPLGYPHLSQLIFVSVVLLCLYQLVWVACLDCFNDGEKLIFWFDLNLIVTLHSLKYLLTVA